MAEFNTGFRESHCGGKIQYRNRREAYKARARILKADGYSQKAWPDLEAYHCHFCRRYWHLGGVKASQPEEA